MSGVTTSEEGDRTVVIESTFDHSIDVVWTLWSDPMRIAHWWGPPRVPLTVDHHDLRAGGTVSVTARPKGGAPIRARWDVVEVSAPSTLRFVLTSDGVEPTRIDVALTAIDARTTRMTITARFDSEHGYINARSIGLSGATDGIARAVATAHKLLFGEPK